MTIERRHNQTKAWLHVYVRFNDKKVTLGTFDDDPYGKLQAETVRSIAKQLIRDFKHFGSGMLPWVYETEKIKFAESLREEATALMNAKLKPVDVGTPTREPEWKKFLKEQS